MGGVDEEEASDIRFACNLNLATIGIGRSRSGAITPVSLPVRHSIHAALHLPSFSRLASLVSLLWLVSVSGCGRRVVRYRPLRFWFGCSNYVIPILGQDRSASRIESQQPSKHQVPPSLSPPFLPISLCIALLVHAHLSFIHPEQPERFVLTSSPPMHM